MKERETEIKRKSKMISDKRNRTEKEKNIKTLHKYLRKYTV